MCEGPMRRLGRIVAAMSRASEIERADFFGALDHARDTTGKPVPHRLVLKALCS